MTQELLHVFGAPRLDEIVMLLAAMFALRLLGHLLRPR